MAPLSLLLPSLMPAQPSMPAEEDMFDDRRVRIALFAVLVALLMPRPAAAQGSGLIAGRVLFENNDPAAQVPVQLRSFTDMGMNQTVTDPAGNFAFRGLGLGVYYVTVRLQGYTEASERVEVGMFGSGSVFLRLRKLPEKDVKPSAPGISAEYLKIPENAREEYEKGMKLYQKENQLEKGLEHLRKAVELHPKFSQAHYGIGLLLMDLDRLDEAVGSLERAIAESPSTVPAYFPLGAIYNHQRKPAEAEKILRKALEIREDIWQLHFELARAVAYLTRWDEAEKHAQRAAELDPGAAKVQLLLANIYFELGKNELALGAAEEFLRLAPDDPAAPGVRQQVEAMRAAGTPSKKPPTQ